MSDVLNEVLNEGLPCLTSGKGIDLAWGSLILDP
jgi:hypothetical protein